MSACISKYYGNRSKFRFAPTDCVAFGDKYGFSLLRHDEGALVRVAVMRGYDRAIAIGSEIQDAKRKSSEVHARAERLRGIFENETTTAAPVLAQAEGETDWEDGQYSAGTRRTSKQQVEMIKERLAKAEQKYLEARAEANEATRALESLVKEQGAIKTEYKVFTLKEIEQGAVLPYFKR